MTSVWTRETLSIDVADELKNEISGKTAIYTNAFDNVSLAEKVATGLWNPDGTLKETVKAQQKRLDQGATSYIVAAFDPRLNDQSGSYIFEDGQVQNDKIAEHASNPENGKRLWELSEKLIGETFDI